MALATDGWLDHVNDAAFFCRKALSGVKSDSIRRTNTFQLAEAEAIQQKRKAEACSELVSSLLASRGQYLMVQDLMECVGWKAQRAAGLALLPQWERAVAPSIGLRGERSGVVIDLAWWCSQAIDSELMPGVVLHGKGVERGCCSTDARVGA